MNTFAANRTRAHCNRASAVERFTPRVEQRHRMIDGLIVTKNNGDRCSIVDGEGGGGHVSHWIVDEAGSVIRVPWFNVDFGGVSFSSSSLVNISHLSRTDDAVQPAAFEA